MVRKAWNADLYVGTFFAMPSLTWKRTLTTSSGCSIIVARTPAVVPATACTRRGFCVCGLPEVATTAGVVAVAAPAAAAARTDITVHCAGDQRHRHGGSAGCVPVEYSALHLHAPASGCCDCCCWHTPWLCPRCRNCCMVGEEGGRVGKQGAIYTELAATFLCESICTGTAQQRWKQSAVCCTSGSTSQTEQPKEVTQPNLGVSHPGRIGADMRSNTPRPSSSHQSNNQFPR